MPTIAQKIIVRIFVLELLFSIFWLIWLILPRFSTGSFLQKALRMHITIKKGRQRVKLREIVNESDIDAYREEKHL